MQRSASSVSTPQPIAYHAGAFGLPVAAISHVTKNCAKPPKIATPMLYTSAPPVARTARGNSSPSIAPVAPMLIACTTDSAAMIDSSDAAPGQRFSAMKAG